MVTYGVICPWIWKNCWIWLCLHSSIYKYRPISTKLGQNVCYHKTLDEFDYGSYQTRTVRVICPWFRKFAIFDFVYTLASANIDQPVPNLATIYMPIKSHEFDSGTNQIRTSGVILPWIWKNCWIWLCLHSSIYKYRPISTKLGQMYVTIRLRMSSIMDLIGPELWVICPWIRKFSIFYFVYTPASANIDQSVPNLATIYMPIKFGMSSILGQIKSEHPKLFALEFGKIAESDFVYTLASTNIDQSTPNLVKMYMAIYLSALEFENLPYLNLFTLYHLQILTNQYQTWPQYI